MLMLLNEIEIQNKLEELHYECIELEGSKLTEIQILIEELENRLELMKYEKKPSK